MYSGLMIMDMIISFFVEVYWNVCLFLQFFEYLGLIFFDNDVIFELFDRVVNVKFNVVVSFGLRGIVVGIY